MSKHKKTKQEKMISDLRRKLIYQTQATPPPIIKETPKNPDQISTPNTIHYTPPQVSSTPRQKSRDIPTFNYSYVTQDLRKTVLLTFLAISIEVILYFVWR